MSCSRDLLIAWRGRAGVRRQGHEVSMVFMEMCVSDTEKRIDSLSLCLSECIHKYIYIIYTYHLQPLQDG